ncbi:Heparan-alpha-glucosaminide N-acetyltransferase [Linum perenne]
MKNPEILEEGLAHNKVSNGNAEENGINGIRIKEEGRNEVSETSRVEQNGEVQPVSSPGKEKSKRVATLDVFRGLTVVLMILVDNAGESYPRMNHTPWNGCNLADFVMPFFLFIVGVAIALALKRVPKKSDAVRRVLTRTLKLLFWGLLLQGNIFTPTTSI